MTASFFDQIADAQTPAPVRRRQDATEKRRAAAGRAEQELRDEAALSKSYRAWKAAKRSALLAGPFGREVKGIVSFLRTITLSSAPALIKTIEASVWIGSMSKDDRLELLMLVSAGIVRCREKAGLPAFDDEIPWSEPPKAFSQIKTLMEAA